MKDQFPWIQILSLKESLAPFMDKVLHVFTTMFTPRSHGQPHTWKSNG